MPWRYVILSLVCLGLLLYWVISALLLSPEQAWCLRVVVRSIHALGSVSAGSCFLVLFLRNKNRAATFPFPWDYGTLQWSRIVLAIFFVSHAGIDLYRVMLLVTGQAYPGYTAWGLLGAEVVGTSALLFLSLGILPVMPWLVTERERAFLRMREQHVSLRQDYAEYLAADKIRIQAGQSADQLARRLDQHEEALKKLSSS